MSRSSRSLAYEPLDLAFQTSSCAESWFAAGMERASLLRRSTLPPRDDLSTARCPPILRAMGSPKRHELNVASSVANVAVHFANTT